MCAEVFDLLKNFLDKRRNVFLLAAFAVFIVKQFQHQPLKIIEIKQTFFGFCSKKSLVKIFDQSGKTCHDRIKLFIVFFDELFCKYRISLHFFDDDVCKSAQMLCHKNNFRFF